MRLTLKNNDLLEKFDLFIKNIKETDRIAVMHHTDPDGICSGVLVSKLIERIRKKPIDLRHNQKGNEFDILPFTQDLFKQHNINKIIIIDVSVDHDLEGIKALESFAELLVIDHHKVYNNINSDKTAFLNPSLIYENLDSSTYCASKFIFDLASRLVDMSDLDWIAAIGLTGDCCVPYWQDFINGVFTKFGILQNKDPFQTTIGKVAEYISHAESYDYKNSERSYNIVYNAKDPKEVLQSELKNFYEAVEHDIRHYIDDFESIAEIYKEKSLAFLEVVSKYTIKSSISTLLSLRYPNTTLIIYQKEGDIVHFSARRHDKKIAVNDLLESATENIPGASAGGHIPAAGGKVPLDQFEKFKANIISLLK